MAVSNAESCKRWRQGRRHDPVWATRERERTRERTRLYRQRQKGIGPAPEPAPEPEPALLGDLDDVLAELLVSGFVDREPEPSEPLARVRWRHWRDIREKEVREGVSIFQGTSPEDVERYRLRFGLDLLAVLAEC